MITLCFLWMQTIFFFYCTTAINHNYHLNQPFLTLIWTLSTSLLPSWYYGLICHCLALISVLSLSLLLHDHDCKPLIPLWTPLMGVHGTPCPFPPNSDLSNTLSKTSFWNNVISLLRKQLRTGKKHLVKGVISKPSPSLFKPTCSIVYTFCFGPLFLARWTGVSGFCSRPSCWICVSSGRQSRCAWLWPTNVWLITHKREREWTLIPIVKTFKEH